MLGTIFLIYVVTQCMSTAFGLTVIDRVQTVIKARLHEKGYVLKNKNSLYDFNDKIIAFAKGFIPFYYAIKAINLTSGKNAIEAEVEKVISSGKYININQEEKEEIKEDLSIAKLDNEIIFEKPEKYTARKNDYVLYDTYVTPIEYVTRESSPEDKLSLTPFLDENRIVEHVMVKESVTKTDIAKAIGELSIEELEALNKTITTLTEVKRNNKLLALKDVA